MAETKQHSRLRLFRVAGFAALTLVVCTLIAITVVKIWLNSAYAPGVLSRLAVSYLQQSLRITSVQNYGGGITLRGIELANPPGTASGSLCRIDEMTITPDWGALLTGRTRLELLSLNGVTVDLRKGASGEWNFTRLARLLAARKSSGREFFIARLQAGHASLLVNGHGARGAELELLNLSSTGANKAKLELSFEDPRHNRYQLLGDVKQGKQPEVNLSLSAPQVSLSGLMTMLGGNYSTHPLEGSASVKFNVRFHSGSAGLRGGIVFRNIPVMVNGRAVSRLNGNVDAVAGYETAADRVRLESLAVSVNDRNILRATATVDKVRSERRFAAALDITRLDLSSLSMLLPDKLRQSIRTGGEFSASGIRVAGNGGGGISVASGSVLLRDALVVRNGKMLFSKLHMTMALSRTASGFQMMGKVFRGRTEDASPLESLDAPVTLWFSPRFVFSGMALPRLNASILGFDMEGRLGYKPRAVTPLNAHLRIASITPGKLRELLIPYSLVPESGTCSLVADVSGRGPDDLSATTLLTLSGVRVQGKKILVLREGRMDARVTRKAGILASAGAVRLNGIAVADRTGEARFSFSHSGNVLFLSDGTLALAGSALTFNRVSIKSDQPEEKAGVRSRPLLAEISGVTVKNGKLEAGHISGNLRGTFNADSTGSWLEAKGDALAGRVSWQGKPVAAPGIKLVVTRNGVRGELSGEALGGKLSGGGTFKPGAPGEGGQFQLGVSRARLAGLSEVLTRPGVGSVSDGLVNATVKGSYSSSRGMECGFGIDGSGIAATRVTKTLVSGAAFTLDGSFVRDRLMIGKLKLSVAPGVDLAVVGTVSHPFSKQREGRLAYRLPATPLNSLIDPFVNMLPPLIQEAVVEGKLASEGSIALRDGGSMLEGAVHADGVQFEVSSQKLKLSDVNGNIPFSLDFTGGGAAQGRDTAEFTRDNYQRLLERFRNGAGNGATFTVGAVTFGPLALGELKLVLNAEHGVTRISSLRTSLYEGAILGAGYVAFRKGLAYRADLLINGLSLTRLCASIPKIQNYISGRVDGIISLEGSGKELKAASGFSELWAREGSGEKMLVSREFLQKLSGKKLSGFFFRSDRPYDQAEINAIMDDGYLTFDLLDISHTNLFGVRDLSVTIAPSQNRIAMDHLFNSIKQAATRGKAAAGGATAPAGESPAEPEFKWQE